ncbi:hypothetical protein JTB14_022221 [Gonioctena quinquepunctata]|nr:hypothetical protein JTB14_022221 [Gonioctena quinquepunctata]
MMREDNLYSNMDVYSPHEEPITEQPTTTGYPGSRRPIPVAVIDQNMNRTFSPVSGLEFLHDVDQLIIQQSVELADLISKVSSENRYTVKIPRGDTIYYATESSEGCQRMCFGSGRKYSMRLFDKTQQEALIFERRLACGSCTFWCYLQKMEVWIPPGELVGTITQNTSFDMKPKFHVYNRHNELLYRIEGPASFGCLLGKAENFQIYNFDGSTQIGSIIYQWDQVQVSYNILLQMPSNIWETRYKALLMGSAFLLEYMFFENSKKNRCQCSC